MFGLKKRRFSREFPLVLEAFLFVCLLVFGVVCFVLLWERSNRTGCPERLQRPQPWRDSKPNEPLLGESRSSWPCFEQGDWEPALEASANSSYSVILPWIKAKMVQMSLSELKKIRVLQFTYCSLMWKTKITTGVLKARRFSYLFFTARAIKRTVSRYQQTTGCFYVNLNNFTKTGCKVTLFFPFHLLFILRY